MPSSEAAMEDGGFFKSIAVAGLGLIGGSIVKALRLKGYTGKIIGIDADGEALRQAEASGLFDEVASAVNTSAEQVELLLLAVPLSLMPVVLKNAAPLIGPHTLVTDAGSVKTTVHEMARSVLNEGTAFIGGHPMAGSDRSGFANASPILFENAYYFLTPEPETPPQQLEKLKRMVIQMGAIPVVTTPVEHDELAARISHLPHLTACVLVSAFTRNQPVDALKYAGGGFRDTTRIAMGDPKLWHDIFTQNRSPLIDGIDVLIDELQQFKALLVAEKSDEIVYNLSRTQKVRQGLAARRPSEESSLYPLFVDLEDRPGTLAAVTGLLAQKQVNIKDIAIDHARETQPGALILSFATRDDRFRAAELIKEAKLCGVFIEQD